jgi:Tfp pilus assembly protein FimT
MSLLETPIGVAVISSLTMIAVPSMMNARENYILNATAHHVAARLRLTRIKAITRNQDCRARITSPVSFAVDCLAGSSWLPDETMVVSRGFTLSANAVPRFHRRGNVSPAATIMVWNPAGRSRRVIVNIAGRVRVE